MNKLIFLFLLALAVKTSGQPYQSTVDVSIPASIQRVVIDGKSVVYYELYITSFASDTIQLKKLRVLNASDSSQLNLIEGENLTSQLTRIGNQKIKNNVLAPGATVIVYMEVNVTKAIQNLIHKLDGEIKNKSFSIQTSLRLSEREPVVLGSPLKGGPWAAVHNPLWERGHRRVIYTIDGRARIPGRYAIDFILLNDKGQFAEGNDNEIKNWFGYGKEVIAVKDGIVLSTRNDFPESTTLSDHVQSTPDRAAGNFVSIDIGGGRVAFYEHLKPGSVNVKPGQKVKKGEVIASLGFTGQTTGPHLHFHVADTNSTLGAEGLPFEFEKFTHLGTYFNFAEFGKSPWTPEKNPTRFFIKEGMPTSNSVIRF